MSTITGTSLRERINSLGTYYWNGFAWIFLNSSATTSGADTVRAGGGSDVVLGLGGNDSLFGEAGNDLLIGGGGADLINGGAGNDRIYGGGNGSEAIGSGNDVLRGGFGNDIIHAGDGNDHLEGNGDNDTLFGEAGDDNLFGGPGTDILVGGAGADALTGGTGGDIFVFNAAIDSTADPSGTFNSTTGDTISGFESITETPTASLRDMIDLRALVETIGHSLTWTGTTPTSYGVWHTIASGTTFINIDTTGNLVADVVIKVASLETLTGSDFLGLSSSVTFAVIGDYGVNNGYELAVANLVKSLNPDFIVTVGDNTYGSQTTPDKAIGKYYSDYIGNYNGAFGDGSATNRFFPVLGNHDWSDAGLQAYLDYFTLPDSSSGNERYYDFTMGPIQFFMVDSDANEPDGRTVDSVQAQWLQAGLAASLTPWQIVVFHEPPYSSGTTHGPQVALRWLFEQWGADAVLTGHEHNYERLLKDDNADGIDLPYFVNGAGGAGLYPFSATPDPDSAIRYNADHGAMLITAFDSEVVFEFWSTAGGGTLIDTFTIQSSTALTSDLLLT